MGRQQVQSPADDAIYIKGQLRDLSTNSVFNFVIKCVDNWAIVTADDTNFLKKMAKTEQRKGNKYIKYFSGKKWVIEQYPELKKQEIAELLTIKLKKGGANITKNGV